MTQETANIIKAIFDVLAGIGILVSLLVSIGALKRNKSEEVSQLTEMRVDIKYIKSKLTDYDATKMKLTEVSSSVKQAHKRLDAQELRLNELENKCH